MEEVFLLPDLGEGIHEGEIVEVLVSSGDSVVEGQPLLIVETDKATVEIPSPFTGVVRTVHVEAGQVVHVGDPLVTVLEPGEKMEEPPRAPESPAETAVPQKPAMEALPVPASPATRRLARELGVDLRRVRPSGPGGRVTAEDVRRAAEEATKAPERPPEIPEAVTFPSREEGAEEPKGTPSEQKPVAPAVAVVGRPSREAEHRVPLKSVRRVIARRMAETWTRVPHVSHHEGVDISELERLRQEINQESTDPARHLSLTPFLVKAAVAVLKEFPYFNASLDEDRQEIVLKGDYHIGVAVDFPRGLVVPVLKEADRKSITELAAELRALSQRARSGELTPEDVSGGNFYLDQHRRFGRPRLHASDQLPAGGDLGGRQSAPGTRGRRDLVRTHFDGAADAPHSACL